MKLSEYFAFLRKMANRRWIRFGLIGGLATLTYFLLGVLFVTVWNMSLLIGNALAYVISFAVSYLGQSRFTFQSRDKDSVRLPRFAAAQLIGLGLNSFIVEACSRLGINYEISMIVASASVPIVVYLLCKFWVFRPAGEKKDA